ncbi:hypothetical protein ELI38_30860 (plasmid) [Rhizobium leguminosarum]|uniref:hypothetical protein n=1 Tax=Rhizobium leguminosarum TaxID=384 RepID=UPI0010311E81|nr:hypothetical protein [Rhizobium leguminosarum]MDH6661608.1 hypothetical protein [Rhizobium sophorae]MBB4524497.1 hypothetical protein [Rhizobium leguminosarum]TAU16644.1 hypothetical protein ELI50_28050 [Rhizobium leguminosarum]TAU35182.1 hypothetical protein ELI51_32125 [Rhizobium leguminosarum]TAU86820.1 hypothetical protein ELI38_30860 [Rhizobium leguminosarum]
MFTHLKLRHRTLVSATPSVPFVNQAKCLIEWGKFTGHALWSVAGEIENQPLDTHHPDRETVLYRGGRDACATLRSGHRSNIGIGFTQTALPPVQRSRFPISSTSRLSTGGVSWIGLMQFGFCLR